MKKKINDNVSQMLMQRTVLTLLKSKSTNVMETTFKYLVFYQTLKKVLHYELSLKKIIITRYMKKVQL